MRNRRTVDGGLVHMTANTERIVSSPDVCHGVPVVRGTRIIVWLILEYLANGDNIDDVLSAILL